MTDNQNPKKRTNNKWLALINIPIQMGAIVFLFSYLGNWLDGNYPNSHNVFVKILTLVGVALAFYNINRQLKDINKSPEE
ncbi:MULTISPECIES: AtpZ/AtpI family protein [unclassified Flavobacterium]|jgi:F0F1-type ATP synthase assembly protein I|uniref:AtpZ/AtpI family protein n=1 Tax=unclassified Flavobacterium TaxID=196869 RepID=UPI0025C5ACEB|nr:MULTISPECIES: AtpZ/AtpI family protein [unclassified Flavobacterium]